MMSPTAINLRRTRRLALVAAIAAASALAGTVHAQYRIDNGSARDANNRVGSGGFNSTVGAGSIEQRVGGSAGNYIVTGNVTGGRAFRGSLGYTDQTSFRGSLGSAAFDTFYRDSVGFGTARGANGGANNFATIQPFFGPGQTVAPPSGFIRDPGRGGGYVVAPNAVLQSNDARVDFGGATRAEVSEGLISGSRVIGGAGLREGTTGYVGSGIAPFDVTAQPATEFQLSEYTTLARVRPGLLNVPIGSDPLNSVAGTNRVRTLAQNDPDATLNINGAAPRDINAPDIAAGPIDGRVDSTIRPYDPAEGVNAGERTGVASSNSQYAELRRRLDAADRTRRLPGSEAVDRVNETNERILRERREGTRNADGSLNPNTDGTRQTPGQPGANTPAGGTRQDNRIEPQTPGNDASRDNTSNGLPPRNQRGTGTVVTGGATPNAGANAGTAETPDPGVRDNLNLPRPQAQPGAGNAPSTRPAEGANGDPVRIKSLATGVRDQELATALQRAETLMKDGRFATAIDTYDRAGAASKGDPIVFMGRSIAELGGGYYRVAETHLRQAYGADRALLYAKFDLRELLGDQRLNFLVRDLGEVARTNPRDPGPLMLLAFIYYNGGMEDRAARALAMAQTRAGANGDPAIALMQQNWKLPAEQPGNTADDPTK